MESTYILTPGQAPSCFSATIESIGSVPGKIGSLVTDVALPNARQLATNISKLAVPAFEALTQLAQTQLGLGLGLITLAIVPLSLGKWTKNTTLAISLLGTSIILFVTGGAFLNAAGLIPKTLFIL